MYDSEFRKLYNKEIKKERIERMKKNHIQYILNFNNNLFTYCSQCKFIFNLNDFKKCCKKSGLDKCKNLNFKIIIDRLSSEVFKN